MPDLLDWIELRRARRQQDWRDVLRPDEIAGGVPSGAVQQQHGVGAPGDMQGYLVEMTLHGVGVRKGQRQRRADAARRADGAEQVGALVTLIGGLGRPRAAAGPLSDKAILLADPRLVLEPDLDLSLARHACEVGRERAGKVFLNAWMTSPSCLG